MKIQSRIKSTIALAFYVIMQIYCLTSKSILFFFFIIIIIGVDENMSRESTVKEFNIIQLTVSMQNSI